MRKDVKLLLLKLVKHNGNIEPIVKMGFQYSQVFEFLKELEQDNLIQNIKNKFAITLTGKEMILSLNNELKRRNTQMWIEPATQHKVVQIDKGEIFLPDQNDLSF